MHTNKPTAGADAAKPQRLYPAGLAFLIEERPLLWYEKPKEYDSLRDEVFAYVRPEDAIECVFTKNLVDHFWEHRRMTRQMHTAINFAMPAAAGDILAPGIGYHEDRRRGRIVKQARRVGHGADEELGDEEASLEEQMDEAGVTPEMIHFQAYGNVADRIEDIRRALERIENRIHWLLKNIETRRAAIAARAAALVEREMARNNKPPETN